MSKDNFGSFTQLLGQFEGTCICIGWGKSAQQLKEDRAWLNYFSISCNYAQLSFPSPLACFQDNDFIAMAKPALIEQDSYSCIIGHKIGRSERSGLKGWIAHRKGIGKLETGRAGLTLPAPQTGPAAAVVAHAMGFKRIILVGFDASPETGYSYFGHHPLYGEVNPKVKHIEQLERQNNFIREYKDILGLVNCSNNGLPRISLSEALEGQTANRNKSERLLHRIHIRGKIEA